MFSKAGPEVETGRRPNQGRPQEVKKFIEKGAQVREPNRWRRSSDTETSHHLTQKPKNFYVNEHTSLKTSTENNSSKSTDSAFLVRL